MVVAERAEAEDGNAAVRLDGQIFLDAELHVHEGGIFGINLDALHTANFRATFIAHGRASLKSRGVVELGVEVARGAGKGAREREHRGNQQRDGDHDEESNKNLLTFSFHLYLLFPSPPPPDFQDGSVSLSTSSSSC